MLTLRRSILLAAAALINMAFMVTISSGVVIALGDDWKDFGHLIAEIVDVWRGGAWTDSFWWGCCAFPAIVVTLTQIAFVLPMLGSRPAMRPHGRSLMRTVAISALIAGALTTGLFFAIAELCGVFEPIVEGILNGEVRDRLPPLVSDWFGALWPWLFIVLGWLVWTPLLLTFSSRRPASNRWSRWVFMLLGGTAVETLIVVPIDVMVRRRTDCYCGSGSFFALVISMWALLWLTGPGVVIALTSKRRRLLRETHCERCGHAKGPSPGELCPECGHVWNQESPRRPASAII